MSLDVAGLIHKTLSGLVEMIAISVFIIFVLSSAVIVGTLALVFLLSLILTLGKSWKWVMEW